MNEITALHTVPAAAELHKVPGFDPLKHLRKSVNAQGEPVMGLEPRYQRLWFRLVCPKGRILLNPLRLTDQLAIFEAKVFFHRDDPTPASSFTSNKVACETPDYIRAAQDEALREALDNAGFGIQLCDVTQTPGADGQVAHTEAAPVKPAPAGAPVEPSPVNDAPSAVSVTDHFKTAQPAVEEESTPEEPTPATEAPAAETEESAVPNGVNAPPSPAYTEDMPVEEICKLMSMEQARSVMVTKGTCSGWTMGQVLEKRPSSLRFYLSGFGHCSNVQMAAATLLAQGLDQQKAS